MAHEERCGMVAQYEYKLYRCARYELCGLAHEERCGWLSTSFADVRVCGWLTKSSAEWLTKSKRNWLSRGRRAIWEGNYQRLNPRMRQAISSGLRASMSKAVRWLSSAVVARRFCTRARSTKSSFFT